MAFEPLRLRLVLNMQILSLKSNVKQKWKSEKKRKKKSFKSFLFVK